MTDIVVSVDEDSLPPEWRGKYRRPSFNVWCGDCEDCPTLFNDNGEACSWEWLQGIVQQHIAEHHTRTPRCDYCRYINSPVCNHILPLVWPPLAERGNPSIVPPTSGTIG